MTLVREIWHLVRFSLVGAIATAVYLLASMVAIGWLELNPAIGATIGFCASFAVSYIGHFHFSFAVSGRYRDYIVRFSVLSLSSFMISTAVVWCMTTLLGVNYRIALIAVAVIIPVCSYLMNRFWVFLHPGDNGSSSGPFKTI